MGISSSSSILFYPIYGHLMLELIPADHMRRQSAPWTGHQSVGRQTETFNHIYSPISWKLHASFRLQEETALPGHTYRKNKHTAHKKVAHPRSFNWKTFSLQRGGWSRHQCATLMIYIHLTRAVGCVFLDSLFSRNIPDTYRTRVWCVEGWMDVAEQIKWARWTRKQPSSQLQNLSSCNLLFLPSNSSAQFQHLHTAVAAAAAHTQSDIGSPPGRAPHVCTAPKQVPFPISCWQKDSTDDFVHTLNVMATF